MPIAGISFFYHSSWFQYSFLVGMPCRRFRLFSFVCLVMSSLVISMLLFFLSLTPTSHLCSLKHVLFPTFIIVIIIIIIIVIIIIIIVIIIIISFDKATTKIALAYNYQNLLVTVEKQIHTMNH